MCSASLGPVSGSPRRPFLSSPRADKEVSDLCLPFLDNILEAQILYWIFKDNFAYLCSDQFYTNFAAGEHFLSLTHKFLG